VPHELVGATIEIGRIYTEVIGKPARSVRIVIEDDDGTGDEMRFELGPADGAWPSGG
jgi:hypothetical protein